MERLFTYASTYKARPSKLHICDNDGIVLCGADGPWMESQREVDRFEDDGDTMFVKNERYMSKLVPEQYFYWEMETVACKKCKKKIKKRIAEEEM